MNSNMKIDKRALGVSLLLTGGTLFVTTLVAFLVQYANPMFLFALVIVALVVFFYFLFKD